MRDVDVLVRLADLDRAVAVLSSRGYALEGIGLSCLARYGRRVSPGWGFVASDGSSIDLHWHVLHESRRPDAADDFWDAAVTIDFAGIPVRALCATDQLLHVCIHGLQKEPLENLRWIADAMSILRCESEPVDWSRFVSQIVGRRLVLQARYTLDYLASGFGAPIPGDVIAALRSEPVSWVERLEFRARLRPETRGRLSEAVVAHQNEVRLGDTEESVLHALPRHLWGASHWWQMPAWSLLDQLGIALPRAVAAPPPPRRRESGIAYEIGRRLVLRRDRSDLAALGAGWAYAESGGVWSEGPLASIVLDVDPPPSSDLELEVEIAAAMVAENGPPLEVHVLVDSSRVARWTFLAPLAAPVICRAVVPSRVLGRGDRHRIGLRILRPRSPASLGGSRDRRPLGIHVCSLRLRRHA